MAVGAFLRLLLLVLSQADHAPSSVVVHGRRGRNSNINGVYIRDDSWHGRVSLCYRRAGHAGGASGQVFLYFEGEWRMGPSPEDGSVWAFTRSLSSSPLLIDEPWQVWDGHRVVQDPYLHVSDTSLVPQVLFLSFGEGSPLGLGRVQGLLMQQPGLWDGRPYYKHALSPLLNGRRLAPGPFASGRAGSAKSRLFKDDEAAGAALPQCRHFAPRDC